jgi:PEP-CTERM motif-containing protein
MANLKWMYLAGGAAAVCSMASAPAQAQLTADGVTYTLTETVVTPTMDDFTLAITGINGPLDTEMGRSGVQSFAFNDEGSGWSITPPTGFTLMSGGLNSKGCDGSGSGFFCFSANTTPLKTPALAANSSLSFSFAISGSGLSSWSPDFKINWIGSKNNYDLVSESIPITGGGSSVPEPASLGLLGLGLAGLGLARRRGRKG